MPSLDNAFGIHPAMIAARAERAEILASNLANADTPGYQARDLDFSALLASDSAATPTLAITHHGHLAATTPNGALLYRQPLQTSIDQNSVDVQLERAAYLDNALRYQASLTFLNGRIASLKAAWRGE